MLEYLYLFYKGVNILCRFPKPSLTVSPNCLQKNNALLTNSQEKAPCLLPLFPTSFFVTANPVLLPLSTTFAGGQRQNRRSFQFCSLWFRKYRRQRLIPFNLCSPCCAVPQERLFCVPSLFPTPPKKKFFYPPFFAWLFIAGLSKVSLACFFTFRSY